MDAPPHAPVKPHRPELEPSIVGVEEWEQHLVEIEIGEPGNLDLLALPENRFLAPLIRPGIEVLDAGCGNGRHLFAYARAGAIATGVDLSSRLARKIRKQAKRSNCPVLAVAGNIMALPFEKGRFDLYTSFGVYEHFTPKQHRALFAEAFRVLKPGGIFYCEVPHLWSAWTVRRELRYWFRRLSPPRLVWQRNLSRGYLCRCGEAAGFCELESHVFDAWLGLEKGFSLSRQRIKGLPNPFWLARPWFKRMAQACEKREWLGHTLVYIGQKPRHGA